MNAPHQSPADTLHKLALERYSCRGFRPDAVPRETIERVLAIAQRAPSWCNAQPWQLTVGSAAATERARAALLAHVKAGAAAAPDLQWPREYRGVYLQRRRACGLQLYGATGVARGDRAATERQQLENFRFFGAPHVAIVTTEEPLGTYGAIDCGAYVAMFMLAARACGLASIAMAALAAHAPFWREHWGLDAQRPVVCGLAFGYEDTAHPANSFRTARAELADAVRWVA
ncbi:MAG: nitroreductase family protein [Ideonella sp.]|nr:nitroreductase family protein [Ideonella sp.]MCC7457015.1 nitroreductase family protein [Nitrospira sp.]